ncbi:DoxX family protein [Thermomonospora umbrina]|uniref:DoxX-like protein n=1 Tax=Thermomonospora umbrina TaxID=111806 RepID=A0A3D9SK82_9ACTN|nr:DoxX family protein [Thermomonospora umbrina]REE96336.1 DoxX-like protein [Thermomonospora umbrina]
MSTALIAVVGVTIAANAAIVVADLARIPFVLANMAEVNVPRAALPALAALKAAGAAGLLLGLLGADALGVAAAAGLVLFYLGAVAAHVRARVFYNIAIPGAFLALAVASLVLMLGE